MTELIKDSPFYNRPRIIENDYAFAIYDGFAVSKGRSGPKNLNKPISGKSATF